MDFRAYRTSILLIITFAILLSTFWFFPDFAFIIFLSMLLQIILRPVVCLLEHHHVPRALASGIVLLVFISLLGLFFFLISKTFLPTFQNFLMELPNLTLSLQNLPFFHDSDFLQDEISLFLSELRSFSAEILRSSLSLILALFSKVIDFVIIIFITFYLLKDGEEVKSYLAHLFPRTSYERVTRLFNELLTALRAYILSQLTICAITGCVVFTYFTLRDVPYASVFAFLSGLGEFIPVLGPTVTSVFGTLLTITQAPDIALQTMFFYLILTQTNHNLIYPTLIGKSVNLHPIAIILSVILGGELLGAAGMFLAVPVTVILKTLIGDISRDRSAVRHQRGIRQQFERQLRKVREKAGTEK